VSKLVEAFKGEFTRHVESFGRGRVVQVVGQAVAMGYSAASFWLSDEGFMRYLSFLDFNQPLGFRSSSTSTSAHG
jgi:hypothetical protein